MSKQKKLSMKDRLAIHIKKKKPARLWVLLVVSAALMACLIMMGLVGGKVSRTEAPAALTTSKVQFRMTVTGDVTVDDNTRTLANQMSYERLLRGVSRYWSDADVVMANISGPILRYSADNYTSRNSAMDQSSYVRPAAMRGFAEAGINLLSFANEEVFNYGITGIRSTISLLEEAKIDYLGITSQSDQPYYKTFEFDYVSEDGVQEQRSVSVLSINDIVQDNSTVRAARPGVINSTIPSIFETVYLLSESSDVVVAYVHFGDLHSSKVTDEQRELAQSLIDAGADLVVGTNTHTVQPVERYGSGVIVYGLGELLSTEDYSVSNDGALLDLSIRNSGEVVVYLTPTHIEEGRPAITDNWLYEQRVKSVLTTSLSENDYRITDDGLIRISLGYLETKAEDGE